MGENSLNAEMEGCAMMVESTKKLVDKCLSAFHGAFVSWNGLHASLSSPSPWVSCGLCVHCLCGSRVKLGALRVGCSHCQAILNML